MKKKSTSSKSKTRSKKQQPKKIKEINKKKVKSNNQNGCEEYIIVNGNIYQPITNTQRNSLHKYIHQLKHTKKAQPQRNINKTPNLEQYVRMLSRSQKANMLKKLQHQMGIQKVQVEDPMIKMQKKIQKIKMELQFQWDTHSDQIAQLYYDGKISQSQKEDKIRIITKIKQHKLKTIDCIVDLLKKIIKSNKYEEQEQEDYVAIINSLNSFEQLEKFPDIENARESISQSKEIPLMQINLVEDVSPKIVLQESKQFIELQNRQPISNIVIKQKQILISQPSSDQNTQNFECEESSCRKLIIPILMTKDKIQQIQQQNKIKQNQILKEQIQKRVSIQLSCLDSGKILFTTLADINRYIQYQMNYLENFMEDIVGALNMPYGKSVLDKIYALQTVGNTHDQYINYVLNEQFIQAHQKQIETKNQYEIIHNKAVFDCFNRGLNEYRPYYEIEGQAYPWIVSEKGITFYQINEDNVQQVFQKTKIKVLEYCSQLCGLISENSFQEQTVLSAKRQQLLTKSIRNQIQQNFNQWQLSIVNDDTMNRLIIAQTIFNQQLILMATILKSS